MPIKPFKNASTLLSFVFAIVIGCGLTMMVSATPSQAQSDVDTASSDATALEYVAMVNDEKISMDDFQMNIDMVKRSYDEMGFSLEDDQMAELKKIILDSLIEKELLLQESSAKGIEIDPASIEAEIDKIRNDYPDESGFEEKLLEMGYTLDILKREIQTNLIIEALIEQEVASEIDVSDEKIASFYDTQIETFKTPEQIRARHILVTQAAGGREKAEELRDKIQEGGDFQSLAKDHSECPSGQNGGDLGYFSRGQMVDAFEDAAFDLEVGAVSDVVETRFGYHIIKLEDHQTAKTQSLESVKDRIKQEIRRQEVANRLQPYVDSLKQKYSVEIHPEMQQ